MHQDRFRAPALSKKGKANYDKIDWSKKAKPKKGEQLELKLPNRKKPRN